MSWSRNKNKPPPPHGNFSNPLCQECGPWHPVTWWPHSNSPTLLFCLAAYKDTNIYPHVLSLTCTAYSPPHPQPIYVLANTCELTVSNKLRGDRKSNIIVNILLWPLFLPSAIPHHSFILFNGIFLHTVLIYGDGGNKGSTEVTLMLQHILKPTQLKNNSRKCPQLGVTLQLTGSLTYQLWGIPLALLAKTCCSKHVL